MKAAYTHILLAFVALGSLAFSFDAFAEREIVHIPLPKAECQGVLRRAPIEWNVHSERLLKQIDDFDRHLPFYSVADFTDRKRVQHIFQQFHHAVGWVRKNIAGLASRKEHRHHSDFLHRYQVGLQPDRLFAWSPFQEKMFLGQVLGRAQRMTPEELLRVTQSFKRKVHSVIAEAAVMIAAPDVRRIAMYTDHMVRPGTSGIPHASTAREIDIVAANWQVWIEVKHHTSNFWSAQEIASIRRQLEGQLMWARALSQSRPDRPIQVVLLVIGLPPETMMLRDFAQIPNSENLQIWNLPL